MGVVAVTTEAAISVRPRRGDGLRWNGDGTPPRPWRRASLFQQALKAVEDQIEAEVEGCRVIIGLHGVFHRNAG